MKPRTAWAFVLSIISFVILVAPVLPVPFAAGLAPAVVSAQSEPPGIFLQFSGGPVLGKRVLTNTGKSSLTSTIVSGHWESLTTIPLSWSVKTSQSDLFNVVFTADCSFEETSPSYPAGNLFPTEHRIRIVDTNTSLPLHPYEEGISEFPYPPPFGGRTFCGEPGSGLSTRTGAWARRMNAGPHNLVVQFFVQSGTLTVDEWTFELVVYD